MYPFIKSPMNYVGGKFKLLDQIIPNFPEDISTFVDVFAGGYNVGLNVRAREYVCNDITTPLIRLYKYLHDNSVGSTLNRIQDRIEEFSLSKESKENYLVFRDYCNTEGEILDLFILMAYSFNNQLRWNLQGKFNMPSGFGRSSFNNKMKDNLLKFILRIKEQEPTFSSLDFEEVVRKEYEDNTVLYLDPPYLLSCAAYNSFWDEDSEERLYKCLTDVQGSNKKFFLSNVVEHKSITNDRLLSWVEESGLNILYIDSCYANCSYHKKDRVSATKEVLIYN